MEELKHVGLEAAWLESLSGCFKSAEMINPFLVLISVGILMFDQRKEQREPGQSLGCWLNAIIISR